MRIKKSVGLALLGFITCLNVNCLASKTLAQQSNIIPDNTLGGENSRLNRNVDLNGINADTIDGGALRDRNLFHSFREFNIDNGQAVYFVNPAGVENILTRVTGGNQSNIFGTLGVDGAANLFLINPNGIVFGENASLDLRGSFVGTTASGLQFGEQGNFSAKNPEIPGNLSVNPSALFFNQVEASGGIINKSQAPAGINPNGDETTGLRVADGKSLLLVGGDINFDGGRLRAYEGNIELAAVTSPGRVGLDISGDTFSLNIPEDLERGDISLLNQSFISVLGAGGGNFTINARNLEISDSIIFAGIAENSDNKNVQAGDVNLNATGLIEFKGNSAINNSVNSQGNAGNININANSVSLSEGSQISTDNFGVGNAGNININARENISLEGADYRSRFDNSNDIEDTQLTTISSLVLPEAIGNAGNIQLTTRTLSVTDAASIYSDTFGKGNAGNITINAGDTISFENGSSSSSSILPGGVGKGGDIRVITQNLSLTNGSQLSTNVLGEGNAGNIFIEASDSVKLDGALRNPNVSLSGNLLDGVVGVSGIKSDLLTSGVAKGGDIQITTNNLSVSNLAEISSSTIGQGNAGNITINARDKVVFRDLGAANSTATNLSQFSPNPIDVGNGGNIRIKTGELLLKDGGLISAINNGGGNAGNIFLDVRDTISFDGIASNNLKSNASTFTTNGNAGNIEVKTGSLFLTNGGYMNALLSGEENASEIQSAGDIKINARDTVKIDGELSGLITNLLDGKGKGGNIEIATKSLSVTNGAVLSTLTSGQGNAGNVEINASDTVTFDKQGFVFTFVNTNAIGNGGNIQITTGSFFVNDNSLINSATAGKGDAGKIRVDATDLISLSNSGSIFSTVNQGAEGKGGEIKLNAANVDLNNNSRISAGTFGKGNAGEIEINVRDLISLSNSSLVDSNIGSEAEGKGGFIDIDTQNLRLIDDSGISSRVFGKGKGGEINVNASESVTVSSGGIFTSTETGASGDAGNITVTTDNFGIKDNAIVNATTFNDGNAGNITFNANTFEATNGGRVVTATDSSGDAGTIKLNIKDKILLSGNEQLPTGLFASTSPESTGKGGSINIDPRLVIIENGAGVSVGSDGKGVAGDIDLQAGTLQLNNGFIAAQTASTEGGNIDLQISELLLLRNQSQISTTAGIAQAGGDGGNIDINSKFIVSIPEENSDITANAFSGNGGKVNIISSGIFGIESQEKLTNKSDITASSEEAISGETNINADDTSSIQNSFTELSPNIDTDAIIAKSCIARSNKRQENSFIITPAGALPSNRPGNVLVSEYITGEVRNIDSKNQVWQKGDRIIEPQGLYRMKNGELLLSRECTN